MTQAYWLTSSAWAACARTGNRDHAGLSDWPAYTIGWRFTMILTHRRVAMGGNQP